MKHWIKSKIERIEREKAEKLRREQEARQRYERFVKDFTHKTWPKFKTDLAVAARELNTHGGPMRRVRLFRDSFNEPATAEEAPLGKSGKVEEIRPPAVGPLVPPNKEWIAIEREGEPRFGRLVFCRDDPPGLVSQLYVLAAPGKRHLVNERIHGYTDIAPNGDAYYTYYANADSGLPNYHYSSNDLAEIIQSFIEVKFN
jgi:hypothetical protein